MYNDMDQVLSSGISVIIPCYNVQAYVRRAVASAVAQTLPPEEIICIDDGSTDDTLAILRELEAEHPDLVRVLTGPNTGAAAARNRGLTVAQSTFIQFLDADDELDPNKFSMQVELAGRNKADLVAGTYRYRHTDGQVETRVAEPGNPWVRLLQKRMGITSSNLWRRSTVVAVGGWDEGLVSSQEADLMARMLKEGAIVAFDPDPRTTVHAREGSISHEFTGPNRERYVEVRAEVLRHCEEHGLLEAQELEVAREVDFNSIRNLYARARPAALAYYLRALPVRYCPPVSAHNTRPYVLALRLLGFDCAERVRSIIRRHTD